MGSHRRVTAAVLATLAIGGWLATCASTEAMRPGLRPLATFGLALEACLMLLALAGALLSSRPLVERLGLGGSRLSGGRLTLLVAGTVALSHSLDCVLELSGLREDSVLAAFDETLAGARGADLLLALLALALAPALGEELLCRGWIQRGLEPRLGGARAVTVGALVFGILHVDPVHAAFATLLGLYLGAVALLAGSVRASVLCHGVNNAFAVLFAAGVLGSLPHTLTGALLGLAVAGAALLAVAARPVPGGPGAVSAHEAPSTLQPKDGSDDP